MWRGVSRAAGNRGRGAAYGRVQTSTAEAVEQEGSMTASPGGADVSRETVSRETWANRGSSDTPIGAAAERAMHVLHTANRLPRPHHRRVFTIANQKGGV